jgi:hypothetical protein
MSPKVTWTFAGLARAFWYSPAIASPPRRMPPGRVVQLGKRAVGPDGLQRVRIRMMPGVVERLQCRQGATGRGVGGSGQPILQIRPKRISVFSISDFMPMMAATPPPLLLLLLVSAALPLALY